MARDHSILLACDFDGAQEHRLESHEELSVGGLKWQYDSGCPEDVAFLAKNLDFGIGLDQRSNLVDHIDWRSIGGRTRWEAVVAAWAISALSGLLDTTAFGNVQGPVFEEAVNVGVHLPTR
jgi:hypothetical protein